MIRKRESRVRRSSKEWESIVRKQESSGLSSRAFCKREGLSAESFRRWRKKLSKESSSEFVELSPALAAAPTPRWECELVLPNGVFVRLRG